MNILSFESWGFANVVSITPPSQQRHRQIYAIQPFVWFHYSLFECHRSRGAIRLETPAYTYGPVIVYSEGSFIAGIIVYSEGSFVTH